MSRLAPGLIELNKGLDLNTAKIAAPEGTLLDSLNYEQVDFQGQKRIEGYARYDGSKGSYIDDFLRTSSFTSSSVADVVYVNNVIFGVVVGSGDDYTDVAVINETLINKLAGTAEWGRNLEEYTPQEHYELVLQYNEILRQRATTLPGPVAGLHWFNDRLYAVASVPVVSGSGYPNEFYNGYPILKSANGLIYLGTSDAVGTTASDVASFFVSRNEAQAEEELGDASMYGWEFVHQGWEVPFEEGLSLYGSLVALNQNRKGVGVQGPTSVAGNNGRPLVVTQKVNIINLPVQVNGWKTSDSRTTYNLDVNALTEVDNWTIYADAFFSWDGESGTVSSTGIHSGALVEYIPNNTVEVEV